MASRKQDFRIQGHATHAFTYFWTSPLPRAARKYRRGSRTRAPPFFFLSINFRQREQFLPYSPPYIEWKCVQASYFFHFLFSFSLCLQRENMIRGIIVMSFLKRGKKNASSKMKRIQSMSFRRIYIIDRSPSSYKLDQSSCNYEGKTDYRYIYRVPIFFFSSIARIKKRRKISLSSSISIRTSWSVDLIPNDYPPPSF